MTVAHDVEVEKKYENGKRSGRKAGKTEAITYPWCVALGRKDFYLKKALKDREAPENAQSFTMYKTLSVLQDVFWWRRAGISRFSVGRSNPKPNSAGRVAT